MEISFQVIFQTTIDCGPTEMADGQEKSTSVKRPSPMPQSKTQTPAEKSTSNSVSAREKSTKEHVKLRIITHRSGQIEVVQTDQQQPTAASTGTPAGEKTGPTIRIMVPPEVSPDITAVANQSEQYKQQLQRFLQQEEENEKLFLRRMADKQLRLEILLKNDSHRDKVRQNAELVKRKKAADDEADRQCRELREEFAAKADRLRIDGAERIKKMVAEKRAQLESLRRSMIELHERELDARKRQLALDVERCERTHIRPDELADQREFQKKIMVELKGFPDTVRLADEYALRSKYGATVQKNAVATSQTCVLYRGQIGQSADECLVKIVVISSRPIAYRKRLDRSTKIYRYLTKDTPPAHPALVKVYDIFYSEQKVYTFMQECDTVNLLDRARRPGAITVDGLRNIVAVIVNALEYLHQRAFAHLKVRPESVIFDRSDRPKLVGFGNVAAYFDAETAKHFKLDRFDRWNRLQDNHLPKEVFRGPFDPAPVDVYSLGAMVNFIYLVSSRKVEKRRELRACTYINLDQLADARIKTFVAECTQENPAARPNIFTLKENALFKSE